MDGRRLALAIFSHRLDLAVTEARRALAEIEARRRVELTPEHVDAVRDARERLADAAADLPALGTA